MFDRLARRFIDALGRLESGRDVEPFVATFADDSEVGNVLAPERFPGHAGARRFWTEYCEAFADVRWSFRNVVAADARAALEWTTRAPARPASRSATTASASSSWMATASPASAPTSTRPRSAGSSGGRSGAERPGAYPTWTGAQDCTAPSRSSSSNGLARQPCAPRYLASS